MTSESQAPITQSSIFKPVVADQSKKESVSSAHKSKKKSKKGKRDKKRSKGSGNGGGPGDPLDKRMMFQRGFFPMPFFAPNQFEF